MPLLTLLPSTCFFLLQSLNLSYNIIWLKPHFWWSHWVMQCGWACLWLVSFRTWMRLLVIFIPMFCSTHRFIFILLPLFDSSDQLQDSTGSCSHSSGEFWFSAASSDWESIDHGCELEACFLLYLSADRFSYKPFPLTHENIFLFEGSVYYSLLPN